MLDDEDLDAQLIVAPGRRTNISMNLVSTEGSHVTVGAGNANQALTAEALMPTLDQVLPSTKYLYMGTCYKLDGLLARLPDIAALGRSYGAKIVVDHGRYTDKTTADTRQQVQKLVLGADLYLPSRQEFLLTWEISTVEEGLRLLRQRAPALTVALKDGKAGAHYLKDEDVINVPGVDVPRAYNLTGAGDTFNAGLLSALVSGADIEEAIRKGCLVAADHITKEVK
jgi:sugar/nucleoside kinase (ribokinase family)